MRRAFNKSILVLLGCSLTHLAAFEIRSQSLETEPLGYGRWDIDGDGELLLIKQFLKPGNIVFDVGGNHGEWSLFALKTEPSVQIKIFEPVLPVFNHLKEVLQNYSEVQFFNYALSDEIGTSLFHYYEEADGLSGFYFREVLKEGKDPLIISVRQETLDAFCADQSIQRIDLMKIDTEGGEWRILKGAENLLKNHQIRAIQFEYGGCYIDAKTTLNQVMRFLTENQYLIFRIFPKGLIHISKWDSSLENFHLSNYFAICKEDLPGYGLVSFE